MGDWFTLKVCDSCDTYCIWH